MIKAEDCIDVTYILDECYYSAGKALNGSWFSGQVYIGLYTHTLILLYKSLQKAYHLGLAIFLCCKLMRFRGKHDIEVMKDEGNNSCGHINLKACKLGNGSAKSCKALICQEGACFKGGNDAYGHREG